MSTWRGLGELRSSLRTVERRRHQSAQGAMLAMAMLEIESMRLAAEAHRIDVRLASIAQRQAWITDRQRYLWTIASQHSAAGTLAPMHEGRAAQARGLSATSSSIVATATPMPVGARSRRLGY